MSGYSYFTVGITLCESVAKKYYTFEVFPDIFAPIFEDIECSPSVYSMSQKYIKLNTNIKKWFK